MGLRESMIDVMNRTHRTLFDATKGRVNWSQKLRDDHRLMAAVEKLLKRAGDGTRVHAR